MLLLFLDMVYRSACDNEDITDNGLFHMAMDTTHRMDQLDRMIIIQFLCNRRKDMIGLRGAPRSCYTCMALHQKKIHQADLDAAVRMLAGKASSLLYSSKIPEFDRSRFS